MQKFYQQFRHYSIITFQLKRYNDALEAAFTYYVHHPNNEVAESNIQYYLRQLNIDVENVKNAESYVSINRWYINYGATL